MKRLVIASFCAILLVLGLGKVVAARSAPNIETFPSPFVMTSAGCSNLPPGTTITGTGTERSHTVTLDNRGVTTIINKSHAQGTATDQNGNTYVFVYDNEFQAVLSDAGVVTGRMVDHFSLDGRGPVTLHNGFVADFTVDTTTGAFSADPKFSFGDPIDFATGAAHCDPL